MPEKPDSFYQIPRSEKHYAESRRTPKSTVKEFVAALITSLPSSACLRTLLLAGTITSMGAAGMVIYSRSQNTREDLQKIDIPIPSETPPNDSPEPSSIAAVASEAPQGEQPTPTDTTLFEELAEQDEAFERAQKALIEETQRAWEIGNIRGLRDAIQAHQEAFGDQRDAFSLVEDILQTLIETAQNTRSPHVQRLVDRALAGADPNDPETLQRREELSASYQERAKQEFTAAVIHFLQTAIRDQHPNNWEQIITAALIQLQPEDQQKAFEALAALIHGEINQLLIYPLNRGGIADLHSVGTRCRALLALHRQYAPSAQADQLAEQCKQAIQNAVDHERLPSGDGDFLINLLAF